MIKKLSIPLRIAPLLVAGSLALPAHAQDGEYRSLFGPPTAAKHTPSHADAKIPATTKIDQSKATVLAKSQGCIECHTTQKGDTSFKTGPNLYGLFQQLPQKHEIYEPASDARFSVEANLSYAKRSISWFASATIFFQTNSRRTGAPGSAAGSFLTGTAELGRGRATDRAAELPYPGDRPGYGAHLHEWPFVRPRLGIADRARNVWTGWPSFA